LEGLASSVSSQTHEKATESRLFLRTGMDSTPLLLLNQYMFSKDLSMLSLTVVLVLKMVGYFGSYAMFKFDVEICLASIHDC
jgi:hypothetical protein